MNAPSPPRPAATVILLRSGGRHAGRGLEVLLAQRNPGATFMPGVWVFPGGAVSDADGMAPELQAADVEEAAYRACALRELAEEAGVTLDDPDELVPWSRWITPEAVPVRFDTRFYLAPAPAHSEPRPDDAETVAVRWIEPRAALEEASRGELSLVFPTIKNLEALAGFASAAEALEAGRMRAVEPILPRVVGTREEHRVVLPGEPGYDEQ